MTDSAASHSALRRSLPNLLTISRVALAVVFFIILGTFEYSASPVHIGPRREHSLAPTLIDPLLIFAAAVFILAAVTDALDGHLARRWQVVSVFGRVMDPFADKVLVLGAFILLAGRRFADPDDRFGQVSGVYPWMAVVILARELLITSLRAAFETRGVSFAATPTGKLKMILQCVCIPLVLLLVATQDTRFDRPGIEDAGAVPPARMVIDVLVWLTVIITAWSGVPYIARAVRVSRTKKDQSPAPH